MAFSLVHERLYERTKNVHENHRDVLTGEKETQGERQREGKWSNNTSRLCIEAKNRKNLRNYAINK